MPSKLIVLPTESLLGAHGLSKGNGKRVASCDDDSDVDGAFATGDGVTVSRPNDDDVASEAYPDSDAPEDHDALGASKSTTPSRKKVRSEASSSGTMSEHGSDPSIATSTSRTSTSSGSRTSAERLATITVSTATSKPTVWDNYYRKQQEAAARKGGGCTATRS